MFKPLELRENGHAMPTRVVAKTERAASACDAVVRAAVMGGQGMWHEEVRGWMSMDDCFGDLRRALIEATRDHSVAKATASSASELTSARISADWPGPGQSL